jgi:hypothetical protein
MALPTTRQQLIDWCLRELGHGVIDINVSEEQIEDRVDEALSYFKDYHFDGVEHYFYNHKITATKLNFVSPSSAFSPGEIITGQTSGAKGTVIDQAEDNLSIRIISDIKNVLPFANSEAIIGERSLVSKQLAVSNALILGDLDNRYITLPDKVISISDILPLNVGAYSSSSFFDVRYQFALTNMHNFLSTDLVSYEMFKNNVALWSFMFDNKKAIHFNRKTGKLYLDVDWVNSMHPDMYVIVDCQAAINPTDYANVYSDLMIRKYTTALLKRQWGSNLKKYGQIQLSGGVVLNGKEIYDEADAEIEKLETRISKEFSYPLGFDIG